MSHSNARDLAADILRNHPRELISTGRPNAYRRLRGAQQNAAESCAWWLARGEVETATRYAHAAQLLADRSALAMRLRDL